MILIRKKLKFNILQQHCKGVSRESMCIIWKTPSPKNYNVREVCGYELASNASFTVRPDPSIHYSILHGAETFLRSQPVCS
jgi:hypothetical protein